VCEAQLFIPNYTNESIRSAAVHGATYILGRSIEYTHIINTNSESNTSTSTQFSFKMEGFINPLTSDFLVSPHTYLHSTQEQIKGTNKRVYLARAILILEKPFRFPAATASEGSEQTESPIDTSIVVFPPTSKLRTTGNHADNPVFVLTTGDGTMCCPQDQCKP
jgi:RAB protein geranylgeranyltransferase component A